MNPGAGKKQNKQVPLTRNRPPPSPFFKQMHCGNICHSFCKQEVISAFEFETKRRGLEVTKGRSGVEIKGTIGGKNKQMKEMNGWMEIK